jgi:Holliday junction resolvase RusA-like endonuclease
MTQKISFTLPIVPTAQARPKVTVRNGFAHGYKSKPQQANERTLEACLLEHKPTKPLEGPVSLTVFAYMPVPKSASKAKRRAIEAGEIRHTKKPDLDNIVKQLKDCLTRLQFWRDDCQVVSLRAAKIYADSGSWAVTISEIGGEK